MESSPYTDVTLEIFETLWQQGYRNIGVVLQSDLLRSEAGRSTRINALGARVRLVKGAYKEPKARRVPEKADVDAAYARMMKRAARPTGTYPAIATHDPAMIDATRATPAEHGIAPRSVRIPDAVRHPPRPAAALVRDGYRVRVYIPFGREWFPYFMRRLGERPANVGFVIRGILGETVARHRRPSAVGHAATSARQPVCTPSAQLIPLGITS